MALPTLSATYQPVLKSGRSDSTRSWSFLSSLYTWRPALFIAHSKSPTLRIIVGLTVSTSFNDVQAN